MDNKDITSILDTSDNGSATIATPLSSSAGAVLNIATITCIGVIGFVIGVGISKFVSRTLKLTDHDEVDDSSATDQADPPMCRLETAHQAALRLMVCDGSNNTACLPRVPMPRSIALAKICSTKDDLGVDYASAAKDLEDGLFRPPVRRVPTPQPMVLPVPAHVPVPAVRGSLSKLPRVEPTRKSSDCQLLRRSGSYDQDDEYYHLRKESV